MKNFENFNQFEELSDTELLEIEGGVVDKNSWSYRIGHAAGEVVGAIEASALKLLNSIVF